MPSAVIDKLRGLMRRSPLDDAAVERPTLDWNPVPRKLDAMARELGRLSARQAALEARTIPQPTSAIAPATPTTGDVARLEATIAALQTRAAELAAGQSSMAAAMGRAEDEVAQFQGDRDEIVRQLTAIYTVADRDRARLDELATSVRAARAELSAATRQWSSSNVDWTTRADDLGRRFVSRLGPLYLVSLLALIASLSAIALVLTKL